MKKIKIALFTIVCLLGFTLSTQSMQAQGAYSQGELAVSAGFGAGGYGGFFSAYNYVPVVFHAEYGFTDIISGGAFVGLGLYTNTGSLSISPDLALGVRVTGHLFPILNKYANTSIDDSKADVYLSVLTGAVIRDNDFTSNTASLILGPVVGGEYFFAGPLGVYAEFGTGALTYATFGLTLKVGGN